MKTTSKPAPALQDTGQAFAEWNDTSSAYPADQGVHQLFAEQARRTPEATAAVYNGESLSYRELDRRAEGIAGLLAQKGAGTSALVPLFLERSLEMIIGILGVLKAGGAYVPLEAGYPDERLAYMLKDTAGRVVLTQAQFVGRITRLAGPTVQVIVIDEDLGLITAERGDPEQLDSGWNSNHPAYVIYTSGTTGRPKGVVVEHRALCNRITWMQNAYQLRPEDRILQKTPYSFDVSGWEFFWPLIAGAGLVFARPEGHKDPGYLREIIQRENITVLHFVPSMLRAFLLSDGARDCASLKKVICSGEPLPTPLKDLFFEVFPEQELHNLYGPTEAAIDVTFFQCRKEDRLVPIGKPIANTQIHIVDGEMNQTPVGIPGELCIAGDCLARGYLNQPELTAQKFVANPFNPGTKLYRTGDKARWLPDGNIEYLGRIDHQIKIRGNRVELEEIESVLLEQAGVAASAVVVSGGGSEDPKLVAYVVPDSRSAAGVFNQLRMAGGGRLAGVSLHTLANGVEIAHLNPGETEFLYREIFENRAYLKHGIRVESGDCVWDVGANIGLFSLSLIRASEGVRIHAFEPIPEICRVLAINAGLFGGGMIIHPCGLSDRSGMADFTYYPHVSIVSGAEANPTEELAAIQSWLAKRAAGTRPEMMPGEMDELIRNRLESRTVRCQLRTISEVIRERQVPRIDLLKIDVEKMESRVLQGIEDGDWEKIRQIVIEVHNHGDRLESITSLLRKRGYEVVMEEDELLGASRIFQVYARRPPVRPAADSAPSHGKQWRGQVEYIRDLREALQDKVPDYMVPSFIVPVEQLPLTANGKIDRKALSTREVASPRPRRKALTPSVIEARIIGIWEELLGVVDIGVDEGFFDLGGNSLLAVRAADRISKEFNCRFSVVSLLKLASIREISAHLVSQQLAAADSTAVELTKGAGSELPLPRPVRNERGEGWGEGKSLRISDARQPNPPIGSSSPPSPSSTAAPADPPMSGKPKPDDSSRPSDAEAIETALNRHPSIRQAVVVNRKDSRGVDSLVAFAIPNQDYFKSRGVAVDSKERLEQWVSVWERNYQPIQGGVASSKERLNTIGYVRSDSGEQIPEEEIRECIDLARDQVMEHKPKNILEIGCGTGMLLFEFASRVERYLATDLSRNAIEHIEASLADKPFKDAVTCFRCDACDLKAVPVEEADTVVIHSVAQYFPGIEYLTRLIESLAQRLPPKARIYIGDVRDLRLLRAFHVWTLQRQCPPTTSKRRFRRLLADRIKLEKELVIHPAYFRKLRGSISRIKQVRITPKMGKFQNEFIRFRYDVFLYLDEGLPEEAPDSVRSLSPADLLLKDWAESFHVPRGESFYLTGIPNRRLWREQAFLEWLDAPRDDAPVSDIIESISRETERGIEPSECLAWGGAAGMRAGLHWEHRYEDGRFELYLQPKGKAPTTLPGELQLDAREPSSGPLSNIPSFVLEWEEHVPVLRKALTEELPGRPLPSRFIFVNEFPRLENGGIDREELEGENSRVGSRIEPVNHRGHVQGASGHGVLPSGGGARAKTIIPDYYAQSLAIIGISCVFPGAAHHGEFWNRLVQGVESSRFHSAAELRALGVPEARIQNPRFVPVRLAIEGKANFDPEFFNVSPRQAANMDPQARLLLQNAWQAMEDAGYAPKSIPRTGVFMSAGNNYYQQALGLDDLELQGMDGHEAGLFGQPGMIPAWVSYCLGLKGPSLFVQSLCCSSMTGLHLAYQSLMAREVDYALVGAASLFAPNKVGYLHEPDLNLSPDGHCRPFDAAANGMVEGEGVCVVLLKRALDAIRDGDSIYALLRGIGVGTDGADKAGFYAPSQTGQSQAIGRVLADTGIPVESIRYVEAHGTGTRLGDSIEIAALSEAYGRGTTKKQFCGLGSTKPNIGNLDTVTGLVGCVKVALSLRAGTFPPVINYRNPNPELQLGDSPFYVVDRSETWERNGPPVRAAQHVYSLGGMNAHAIYEDYRSGERVVDAPKGPALVPLSARNRERLRVYAQKMLDFLAARPPASREEDTRYLVDLGYTLQVGREAMASRVVFMPADLADLREKLGQFAAGAENGPGIFCGEVSRPKDLLQLIGDEADRRAFAQQRIAEERWDKVADLWVRGVEVGWHSLYGRQSPFRINLPTYPFEEKAYWLAGGGREKTKPAPPASLPETPAVEPAKFAPAHDQIISRLRVMIGELLDVPGGNLDPDRVFGESGLDSVALIRLTNRLNQDHELNLTPAVLFEYSTINRLAVFLASDHGLAFSKAHGTSSSRPLETTRAESREPDRRVRVQSVAAAGHREPIAIVGMSGRFPQAGGLDAFWENLKSGRDCISEVPAERWSWREYYGDPDEDPTKTKVKWGGFIDGLAEFDPLFFNLSPREAEAMDPQNRLLMMYVWLAMEDAGYSAASLFGTNTGIFIGTGDTGYGRLLANEKQLPDYGFLGIYPFSGPNRMSYFLNLNGPSEPVNTGCSSSLVAVHKAVQALENGDCDLAFAGGVNTVPTPEGHVSFSKVGMLCEDGRCKAFSNRANGFVRGEGVGILVLKRLSDAEKAGDHIEALIPGSAENHGGRSNSFTAPNPAAQAQLLETAWRKAGIGPRMIGYIETHGTGTKLGDPVEVQGLKKAFQAMSTSSVGAAAPRCGLGSVKSNVGHLEMAAGIAGLMKTLLQLRHKTLVRSLYCEEINPLLRIEDSPFYIVRDNADWHPVKDERGCDLPRRAGVSSFGVGGVNAHVVLEEYVPRLSADEKPEPGAKPFLIILSAKTKSALRESAARLLTHLKSRPGLSRTELRSLAYTLQVGRDAMEERLAFLVESQSSVEIGLQKFLDGNAVGEGILPISDVNQSRGALLANGGRLLPRPIGRGEDRGENSPKKSRIEPLNQCGHLQDASGYGVPPLGGEASASPEARKTSTLRENSFALPAEAGTPYPDMMASTSLGSQSPSRSAVHGDGTPPKSDDYQSLLEFWVAGGVVDWLPLYGDSRPSRMPLPGYPFARDRYWVTPPLDSGAGVPPSPDGLNQEDLADQWHPSPVADNIDWMERLRRHDGGRILVLYSEARERDRFLELLRQMSGAAGLSRSFRVESVADGKISSADFSSPPEAIFILRFPNTRDVLRELSGILARKSVPTAVRVTALHAGELSSGCRFEMNARHDWRLVEYQEGSASPTGHQLLLREWLLDSTDQNQRGVPVVIRYQGSERFVRTQPAPRVTRVLEKHWKPENLPLGGDHRSPGATLILANEESIKLVRSFNFPKIIVLGNHRVAADQADFTCDFRDAESGTGLAPEIVAAGGEVGLIVDLSDLYQSPRDHDEEKLGKLAIFQALVGTFTPRRVLYFTNGLQNLGAGPMSLAGAKFAGLIKMLSAEYSHVSAKAVDIDGQGFCEPEWLPEIIETESRATGGETEICYRRGKRHVPRIEAVTAQTSDGAIRLREDAVYVITGGTRGIGLEIGKHLVSKGVRKLAIMGIQSLPPKSDWERILRGNGLSVPERGKLAELIELNRSLEELHVHTGSLTDRKPVGDFFDGLRKCSGPIKGIIHGAGVYSEAGTAPFVTRDLGGMRAVFEPKINGLEMLHELLQPDELDFFVSFSSLTGVIPRLARGMSDYAIANAFLDFFAAYQSRQNGRGDYRTITWVDWNETGYATRMSPEATARLESHLGEIGLASFSNREGRRFFDLAMELPSRQWVLPCSLDLAVFNAVKPELLFGSNRVKAEPAKSAASDTALASRLDHQLEKWERERAPGRSLSPDVLQEVVTFDEIRGLDPARVDRIYGLLYPKVEDLGWAGNDLGKTGIIGIVRKSLLDVLKLPEVDDAKPFQNYGLDSISAMIFSNRLEKEMKRQVPPGWLIDFPTVESLSLHLERQIGDPPRGHVE